MSGGRKKRQRMELPITNQQSAQIRDRGPERNYQNLGELVSAPPALDQCTLPKARAPDTPGQKSTTGSRTQRAAFSAWGKI